MMRSRANIAVMLVVVVSLFVITSPVQAANYMARDHLVVDLRHGVDWLRCSVGQVWNGTECKGDIVRLNHEDIKIAVKQAGEQLGGTWRLPNLEAVSYTHLRSPRD